jgi:putative oxidoreductase
MNAGLLLIRLVVGPTFSAHGAQKLFGSFGGPGPQGTAGFFRGLGYRMPMAMAMLAGGAELFGGLAFAAGIGTPFAALALTIVMLNAILVVHWQNGFFAANGGLEFPLALATVAVGVTAIGPGRFSLDRAFGWDDNISGFWWGVGVALAAAAISYVTTTILRGHKAKLAPTA